MKYHFKILFFVCLLIDGPILASNLSISYDKIVPIFGGMNPNLNYLQSNSTSTDLYEFHYYLGDDDGFFWGVNYSNESANYTQKETTSRSSSNINSTFISIGPEVGIWAKALDFFKVESALSVGFGNFKFKDSILSDISNIESKKIDLHFGLSYPVIKTEGTSLDLRAKIGYYRIFMDEFIYNNITYSSDELKFKQFLYLSLGFGFSF